MGSSLWVLSLGLRGTYLPSAYLNMFTSPDQTLFLKVWIFIKDHPFYCSFWLSCTRIKWKFDGCFFCIVYGCTAGQMVYTVRQRCGRQLAIEAPTDADVVSTVPESATPAALGYAQQVCLQPFCSETTGMNSLLMSVLTSSLFMSLSLTVWAAVHRGSM